MNKVDTVNSRSFYNNVFKMCQSKHFTKIAFILRVSITFKRYHRVISKSFHIRTFFYRIVCS